MGTGAETLDTAYVLILIAYQHSNITKTKLTSGLFCCFLARNSEKLGQSLVFHVFESVKGLDMHMTGYRTNHHVACRCGERGEQSRAIIIYIRECVAQPILPFLESVERAVTKVSQGIATPFL